MADLYYIESGYYDEGYFVYTADAAAVIDSQFTQVCDVRGIIEVNASLNVVGNISLDISKIANGEAAFSTSFTQTATISHIEGADLFAFSEAVIAVQVDRIRENNIAVSAIFDIATDFIVQRNADADVDAVFSAIINGLRSRDTILETQAAFSFDVTAQANKEFNSALSTESVILLTPSRFRNVEIALDSAATALISGDRFRSTAVDLNAEFTVTVDVRKIRDAHLTGTGVATISCDAVKTTDTSSSQQAQFTQIALAGKIQIVNANLPVYSSVFVSRNVGLTRNRPYNLVPYILPGDLTFNTSIKKFGTASFSGRGTYNGDKPIIPGSTEDFYLETWIYWPTGAESGTILSTTYFIQINLNTPNKLLITFQLPNEQNSFPSYGYVYQGADNSLARDVWHHIAVVKTTTTMSYYVNGTRVQTFNAGAGTIPDGFYGPNNGNYWGTAIVGSNPPQTQDRFTVLGNRALVDEFLFVRNSTYGYSPSSTTITVPTEPRVNSSNVQGLYHFDNNANDDLSLVQTANSAMQTQALLTAATGYRATFASAMNTTATVSATIGKLNEINLVAFTDAAVTANVNIFRGYNADCEVSASISATANRIQPAQADLTSSVDVESTPNRLRETLVAQSSLFTVSATGDVIRNGVADITDNFALSATIGKLNEINLVAFTDAAVTANAVKNSVGGSQIASKFTQVASAVKSVEVFSSIASENSLTAINDRLRIASASLSSQGSVLTLANEFQGINANLYSRFYTSQIYIEDDYLEPGYYEQFEINAVKTAQGNADFSTSFALSTSITTSVFAALTTTSQASITANVVKTVSVDIAQSAEFSLSVDGTKIVSGVAVANSQFTVFCNGVASSEINLVAFSTASISAVVEAIKEFNTALSSQTVFIANTQDSLNSVGEADISSEFATVVNANYTASAVIVTEAVASSLSVVVKAVAVAIPLDCNFTQTALASRTRSGSSNQSAIATTNIVAGKTVDAQSAITAQSTVVATARKIVNAVIVCDAVASTLTANIRIAGLFIECAVVSTLTASGVVVKSARATILSTATFTSATVKLVSSSATIVSTGSISATVGVRKPFTAAFTSALTFVVAIRDLRLDEIVYVIPGENYVYTIISESRLHDIYGETRIRSVTGESRIRTITGESRIHIN